MNFLQSTFWGNSVQAWIIGAGIGVAVYLAIRVIVRVVHSRLHAFAQRTSTQWDDLISSLFAKTKAGFLIIVATYAGSQAVVLTPQVRDALVTLVVIALLIQGGIWVSAMITAVLHNYAQRQMGEDAVAVTTLNAVGFVGRLALWAGVLLLALDNLGVDVTALVAGLGVGGIAVALAVQNILSDLFASLSIVLDKPFVIGDFLVIDDFLGTVDHIGLKTTRLRSLSGEQLVFSNADLLGSRIRNYGRMYERRVVFSVGVTYDTPRDKLAAIPGMIQEVIESREQTRFDRSHLKDFGAYSINFETVYHVLVPDYNVYMDIQQALNLRIHELFEREGIEFAFPTQTLHLARQES